MLMATAQSLVTQDPHQNGQEIRALMQQAHDAGARLIHFPEGAMSGYQVSNPQWEALHEELELTATLAKNLNLWTILGSEHRLTPPNRPHNSLYVISDSGDVVARYDKRLCSHNEINHHYTPGNTPIVFSIDGFTFGCALCIEINFPELFLEYENLGVDCLLLSSYSQNPIFGIMAQGHAAANNYWFSISVPAQFASALPAGLIGPDGYWISQCRTDAATDLCFAHLDRMSPAFDIALNKARPWRKTAREGSIYRDNLICDPRSENKASF
ncbi:carbon-nitrogen hydrolase family protein [Asticcacaulis machinosus]|uniref:Carbon-nitrogen hydrolase family protein n=1 Tax=Asticcacaulis machinosus TaxID=2984211 RepID=A0ABT5HI99_9CAUL|nr:carbon-nitrogen hydrolase family protein [Asticcacaulis machinosus]MDC7675866.1 carbon-nitrogen hydrolase family protein [Asticcacaulis machinosus]